MKRLLSLLLAICLILSCAALFSSCGDSKGDNFPVTVGGADIKEEPTRVVVLNDAFADIIMYMGYDTKLVGRSIECDQKMLNVITSVGSSDAPAVDTLTSLNPDLVLADDTLEDKARSKIEKEGITIATFSRATTQEEIKQLYIDLGTALGGKTDGSEKGEESYGKLFTLLAEYNTTTSDIAVTDAYLYLDDDGNYCTFTKDSVEAKIFGYNGAINVFANKTSAAFHSTSITDENGNVTEADETYIRYASPTYLFLDGTVDAAGNITSPVYDKLKNDPNLQNLAALKEGRVSFIPLKNFYRPGVTFEDILFSMIDTLNKETEAEESTADQTEAATEAPTAAPATQAATKKTEPTKAAATKAATEAAQDEEVVSDDGGDNGDYADDANNNADNGDNAGYDDNADNGDNAGYDDNAAYDDNAGNGDNANNGNAEDNNNY